MAASIAAVVIVGAAVGVVTTRSDRQEHGSTPAARVAAPARHATQAAVPVRSVGLFGSTDDHPEQASLAADGNPATAWFTQHYTSASFGNLRPGVGLLLDLGQSATVRSASIQLATPGVDLRVYGGSDPGTLLNTRPVAAASGAPANLDLTFQAPVNARYLLVYFTRLAPSDGAYRAGVSEIALHG